MVCSTRGAPFGAQFSTDNQWLIAYNMFALFGSLLTSEYNQIALFLKVELMLGVMPTDWWSVSLPEYARFPSIPPVLFRFFVRCFVLAIYVFFAVATLSMGIGNIQGLIGALAVAGFSFYLPWIGESSATRCPVDEGQLLLLVHAGCLRRYPGHLFAGT